MALAPFVLRGLHRLGSNNRGKSLRPYIAPSRIKYAQEGGGYRAPEDQWPAMQDGIIAAMTRLEQALRPFLKQLKLNT
jgi:hypothetical protein